MSAAPLICESRILVPNCRVAKTFFTRFLGLMGRKGIPSNEALIFPECNSIHTFFMRFAIDVVMTDGHGKVIEVVPAMKTWRLLMPRRKVTHVIEMAAGRAAELGIAPGKTLACEGAWE